MLIADFFIWWYSRGWGELIASFAERLRNLADFFSFSLLIRTLFSPFRQISATAGDNPNLDLAASVSAFFDRLISRCVGFVVRLALMIAGTFAFLIESALALVFAILWPVIPFAPLAFLALFFAGVTL